MAEGDPTTESKKFGTFLGVFTPSVLTILGVMMYLRFGWVLGNAGLLHTLLILCMASGITFITGLSASAIATNIRVGVGGEYYMVSRSLGLELGGAIGIPLFLCRTLSLTLYAFGLAESLAFVWPAEWGEPPVQVMTGVIILFITAVAGKSASLTLKLQIPIMIAVGLSILALVAGVMTGPLHMPSLEPSYERSAPSGFWLVFAVFFPAVTGFTAGIGMSGDLKHPRKSIPIGTILAVVTGFVTYAVILTLLSVTGKVSGQQLATLDPNAPPIWANIAILGVWLILPGMWGAILSSAFGSALGGPRVLQALATDGLVPGILAKLSKSGQPTVATWVTGGIALLAVLLGDLNAVGRLVTVFFLTLYVTINLSAALEKLAREPSYRPRFNLPAWVSLFGCFAATAVMFLINPLFCLAAIFLEFLLLFYLRRKSLERRWGDVWAGVWNGLARFALLRLRNTESLARNWRPHILLFTANPDHRRSLVRLASGFNQERGIVTVCRAVVGDLDQDFRKIPAMQQEMEEAIDKEGLAAFCEVNIVRNFEEGVINITQANGYAGLQSNTIMFGWPDDAEGMARLLRICSTASRLNISCLLAKLEDTPTIRQKRLLDVWWRGKQYNGDMMLLLGHLLTLNTDWKDGKIRLRTIVANKRGEKEAVTYALNELIQEARIPADIEVFTMDQSTHLFDLMQSHSRNADLVFMGLKIPEDIELFEYADTLFKLGNRFSNIVFVRNAGKFAGELI
ncbi:amino acid permease [Puniceicoccales bacterium CK1056]|uniref:Amino acid permease n=1 Tax=Oceanipulchritudo coccoides TaxID=2706888 RepID=A0A6B2LYU8_9BACT|nr:amino acid permease [Oceanipulchritudo coccoides]NDV61798.1 amino acid permease [Oceanipulchritudo coccoides]